MKLHVRSGKVKAALNVPSSKSMLQRYLIGALLADGRSDLKNVKHCQDTLDCLKAVEALGAKMVNASGNRLLIQGGSGNIMNPQRPVSCGQSGFAFRALAAVVALSETEITLAGEGSLLHRPMGFVVDTMQRLGVSCIAHDGKPPLRIKGPLKFTDLALDGSLSSQLLSGLLMVFPLGDVNHTLAVTNLKSRPYIDLTIQVLADFGISIENHSYNEFLIPGKMRYRPCNVSVEGDWSSAAVMLVAGATSGEATISNLNPESRQADRAIVEVLLAAGARVAPGDGLVKVTKATLSPFSFDATDCPDLFPALVSLAAFCEGTSEIRGVERLIYKESNRAQALREEFNKLNGQLVTVEHDSMRIKGGLELKSAEVNSHNDHRIAMALGITALNVDGGLTIHGAEAADKSYPGFFSDLAGSMPE